MDCEIKNHFYKNDNTYHNDQHFGEPTIPVQGSVCVCCDTVTDTATRSRCSQNVLTLMRYMRLEHSNCGRVQKTLRYENTQLTERLRALENEARLFKTIDKEEVKSTMRDLQNRTKVLEEENYELRGTIDGLKNENNRLKEANVNEKENLRKYETLLEDNESLESKFREQGELHTKKLEKEVSRRNALEKKLTEQNALIEQQANDLKRKEKQLRSIQSKLGTQQKMNDDYLNQLDEKRIVIHELECKLKSQDNDKLKLQQRDTIYEHKQTIKTLENDLKTKEKDNSRVVKEAKTKEKAILTLKEKNNEIENNNKHLLSEISELEKANKELKDKLSTQELANKQVKTQLAERENAIQQQARDLEEQLNNVCSLNSETVDLRRKLSEQSRDTAAVKERLSETLKDQDSTRSRLSQLMGQKLTDNNPNIADLSDKNRPTKLAERYTELYDNQWTDAFEVIDTGNDEENIHILRSILFNAFHYCREESQQQMQTLKTVALILDSKKTGDSKTGYQVTLPLTVNKQLKELRKTVADLCLDNIYQKYERYLQQQDTPMADFALKVPKYTSECLNMCWLMAIQDPPVVFGGEVAPGSKFNTDLFKSYTVSGPILAFVVWPPLYLQEGGALLCKGVAQGSGGRRK